MFAFVCLCGFVLIASTPPDSQPKSPAPASSPKPAPVVREFAAKEPQPKRVTVAEVIKGLILDESKMLLLDEPPGKLNGVRWEKVKLPGTEAVVDVEIETVRTFVLSPTGKYDKNVILSAVVTKVTITPLVGRKD